MIKQLQFSFILKTKLIHGGDQALGKRKSERPLRMNKPIHIVLRAKRSGLKAKERSIQKILKTYADKFNIKIYQASINSNHIHLVVVTTRRVSFQNYLRSITGLIARHMGIGKLWAVIAFSRIANWGKEYKILVGYIHKNQMEALGLIRYTPRTG
jgi:REP element-mobilizing transposase RayT